ncbi:MAG: RNase adapter RapZ [Oscillospiraceae bacterium]|nr:RNase adapter RapZ [Oscillospiraceae bacterium]
MEFLIITGLSGAGKSRAADVLEDLDYYCVDNMPVALMPRFAELCLDTHGRYEKVALVTDVRERDGFGELLPILEELEAMEDCQVRILYMDADPRTLVRRYKESRRPHPLAGPGISVEEAIQKEEELLAPIRERADFIVNSSNLTLGNLQSRLFALFAGEGKQRGLDVTVLSFGFKHGIPLDADLVFDVRFLPNPFYVEELRPLSGLDRPVAEYVFGYLQTRSFMEKLEDMIAFLLPFYIEEGKLSLTIAIGCTGGRHRSVAIAAALHQHLQASGVSSVNINRDIDK